MDTISLSKNGQKVPLLPILHIIDSLAVGGAEKVLIGVVNGLPQYKHHVIYLGGADDLVKELPANCFICKLSFYSKLDLPRCITAIRKYIQQHKIGIVHSHLLFSDSMARIACPSNIKLFNSIHSMYTSWGFITRIKIKLLTRMTYKKHHTVIAVSKTALQGFNDVVGIKGSTYILPNFVEDVYLNEKKISARTGKTLRLLAVGNLKKAKNYFYLLEVFRFLPSNIHLDIYGEGKLKKELQKKIDHYKLPVRLCGFSNQLPIILPSYDAFIMGSRWEGCPLSLLEAMASCLPLILSDIPSLREIAGDDAIYFQLNNPQSLVQKLTDISEGRINLEQFVTKNFHKVKQIASKKDYLRKLSAIYSGEYPQ